MPDSSRSREHTAGSVGELIDCVRTIARTWAPNVSDPQELWFRGQEKRVWNLLPELYRPEVCALGYREDDLFERFKARCAPYLRVAPRDDWEWYYLARHHNLPSRLLDWTENLLVALYFAVSATAAHLGRRRIESLVREGKREPILDDDAPAVWVLDAGTVNNAATGEDEVFVPGGPFTAMYLPGAAGGDALMPIALLPSRSNERLIAQQGVFTLHGSLADPLDVLAARDPRIRLARITLDRANIAWLWEDLQLSGFGPDAVFPSPDSVCEQLRWTCQVL